MPEFNGFYGVSSKNRTTIYTYPKRSGGTWYACEGSTNVNFTYDEIEEGINVETLHDVNTLQARKPIKSEKRLIKEVDE